MRRTIAICAVFVLVVAGAVVGLRLRDAGAPSRSGLVAKRNPTPRPTPTAAPTPEPTATPLPAQVMNQVPYTPQAPFDNWDAAHEHYCTAADTLMVEDFYKGDRESVIPPAVADQQMGAIIARDRQVWPGVLSLPLASVAQTAQAMFGLTPTIEPVTLANVERALAGGHPVLVALMTHGDPGGAAIAPYYGSDNVHHVILLIGYDATRNVVYANDPGFMQGRDYTYSWSTLTPAIAQESPRYDPSQEMLYFTG
ncbi:MAG TPA: C39 family peptidase [Candidatus Dormibacteraeota bacterium]|nr:C39 family peptidase [Candidatus Dormibacteraeota bacterium]